MKNPFKSNKTDEDKGGLIMLHDRNIEPVEVPDGMKKLFLSYTILDIDTKQTGFGNTIALFAPHLYPEGFKQFLKASEEAISKTASAATGRPLKVSLLNIQVIQCPATPKDIFFSYNSVNANTGQNSFGNYQTITNPELYNEVSIEKFIASIQLEISKKIKERTGDIVSVQLLFFR